MTLLNPDSNGGLDREQMKSAVLLGGREMRITLSRDAYDALSTLAQSTNSSPTMLATEILTNGIRSTWQQYLRARFIWQVCNWSCWGDWARAGEARG